MSGQRMPGPLDSMATPGYRQAAAGWLHGSFPGPVGILCTVNGNEGLRATVGEGLQRYYALAQGVVLGTDIEWRVAAIASAYHAETGKTIRINSGTRSARSQAAAMHTKFAAGGASETRLYRAREQAQRLFDLFEDGRAAGKNREAVVDDMTSEIEAQMAAGVFISKHLRAGAVDVRSTDMSQREKQIFRKAAERHADSVILETHPPHWHLQFE